MINFSKSRNNIDVELCSFHIDLCAVKHSVELQVICNRHTWMHTHYPPRHPPQEMKGFRELGLQRDTARNFGMLDSKLKLLERI